MLLLFMGKNTSGKKVEQRKKHPFAELESRIIFLPSGNITIISEELFSLCLFNKVKYHF
jgi:hypothetical protein